MVPSGERGRCPAKAQPHTSSAAWGGSEKRFLHFKGTFTNCVVGNLGPRVKPEPLGRKKRTKVMEKG